MDMAKLAKSLEEILRHSEGKAVLKTTIIEPANCPVCGAPAHEHPYVDKFQYGTGENLAELTATYPMIYCPDCELEYSDERGEAARQAAVDEHLRNRGAQIKI